MAGREPPLRSRLENAAAEHYCIVGPDGQPSAEKTAQVVEALEAAGWDGSQPEAPEITGVARLRGRVHEVRDIAAAVDHFLPEVEKDPHLHALSFLNPLRLATDKLGIEVSPLVARYVRRTLRGVVSFSDRDPVDGVLAGVRRIRWVRKTRVEGDERPSREGRESEA